MESWRQQMKVSLIKACRSLPAYEAQCFKSFVHGGLVTGTTLVRWGYDLTPACPYCSDPDTPEHRVSGVCPRGREHLVEVDLGDLAKGAWE